ncbi:MAG: prephenate dehydrogenase/arogenate dehydrogenase family protein, partial [Lentisphaeria bacterium]|nr:prephenate dehydrogenase/arogenate dehydrogenase family protein [Lentisphaeria bacterium]
MAFQNVAIIGMGLLGTSLGMALREKGFHRLCWTRRSSVRAWCLEHDAADETADDIETILAKADLTVFALPIPQIIAFLEKYTAVWRKDAVVTDMGSIKGRIMEAAERSVIPAGVQFIGSHPMAGTEKSGCENAFPTLYRNADVFITPGSNATEQTVED